MILEYCPGGDLGKLLIKKGKAIVEEIPTPFVERGTVLVETAYSCISIGTEMSGVKEGSKPIIQRAIEHPEYVAMAAKMALAYKQPSLLPSPFCLPMAGKN